MIPNTVSQEDLRRRVLEVFVRELEAKEGENLLRVVLFGSVARRTDLPDSDIDVFVMLRKSDFGKRGEIVDIAVDVDYDYGEYKTHLAPLTMAEDNYRESVALGLPLLKNIQRDGVVLFDRAQRGSIL